MTLQIRKARYRDKDGFTVSGEYPPGSERRVKIFFDMKAQAQEYVRRRKAGENGDQICGEIWGHLKPKHELRGALEGLLDNLEQLKPGDEDAANH